MLLRFEFATTYSSLRQRYCQYIFQGIDFLKDILQDQENIAILEKKWEGISV